MRLARVDQQGFDWRGLEHPVEFSATNPTVSVEPFDQPQVDALTAYVHRAEQAGVPRDTIAEAGLRALTNLDAANLHVTTQGGRSSIWRGSVRVWNGRTANLRGEGLSDAFDRAARSVFKDLQTHRVPVSTAGAHKRVMDALDALVNTGTPRGDPRA